VFLPNCTHLRSKQVLAAQRAVADEGRDRCTLLLHTADAQQRGVRTGDVVEVVSPIGKLQVPVEVTDAIKPGVVTLPHGWGQGRPHQRAVSADVRRRTVGALTGIPVTVVHVGQFIPASSVPRRNAGQ
jgi:anaerobic selenocysteine-containing dehydrogenase